MDSCMEDFARVFVCVDDTDDLTKRTSTGKIASLIAREVAKRGGAVEYGVSRHQLLLREDVPYTSHNSSMCFSARMPRCEIEFLREQAIAILGENCAETSDPGLCIFSILGLGLGQGQGSSLASDKAGDEGRNLTLLAEYGRRAKEEFVTKEEAYALAAAIPGIALSEHGGTGVGVVGALAGVGLRIGGNDGRFRGKWDLAKLCGGEEELSCSKLLAQLSNVLHGPVSVVDVDANLVAADARIILDGEAKPILHKGNFTIVVDETEEGVYRPCGKQDLGAIGDEGDRWAHFCRDFALDNDAEEMEAPSRKSCYNCLYRRWVPSGFSCSKTGKESSLLRHS